MSEFTDRLAESQRWLEELHAKDARKALAKLHAGKPLTAYERGLIPEEVAEAERAAQQAHAERQAAQAEMQRRLDAAHAAERQVRDVLIAKQISYRDRRVERMAERAVSLALKHGIALRAASHDSARADVTRGIAHVSQVTCGERFAAALHEFAHVVDPAADGRQSRHRKDAGCIVAPSAEVAAWRQAMRWADDLWTKSCFLEMTVCLDTYRRHATEAERAEMRTFVRTAAAAVVDGPVDEAVLRDVFARFAETGPVVPWLEPTP